MPFAALLARGVAICRGFLTAGRFRAGPRFHAITLALAVASLTGSLRPLDAVAQGRSGYVPAAEVEATAQERYGTDCPYAETIYERAPLRRPVRRHQPAEESADCGSVFRAVSYGVSMEGFSYTRARNEVGQQVSTFTDGFGRTVRSVADPGGIDVRTAFTYDALGRLTKVVQPEGEVRTFRYDARGLVGGRATAEADGNANGDPTDEDATAGVADTRYKYDRAGALRFRQGPVQKAQGEVLFQQYDGLGRPTESGVAPLPSGIAFSRLEGPREKRYGFEKKRVYWRTVRVYDGAPDTASVPWSSYDWVATVTLNNVKGRLAATARRVAAGRPGWRLTFRSYGPQGHLKKKWVFSPGAPQLTLRYGRDRQGRLTYRRAALAEAGRSFCWWYAYTPRGLVKGVYAREGCPSGSAKSRPATAEVIFTYTAAGRVEQTTYKGGPMVPRRYDARGRLTRISSLSFGGSQSPFGALYHYRADGSVRWARFLQKGRPAGVAPKYRYDYRYDALGRLRAADYRYYTHGTLQQTGAYDVLGEAPGGGIAYDRSGNLLGLGRRGRDGRPVDRLALRYGQDRWDGPSGRLTGARDASGARYDWDAAGGTFSYDRTGRITQAPAPYGIAAARYDERGLPVAHILSVTGDTIRYRYSLIGKRTYQRVGAGVPTHYVLGEGGTMLATLAGSSVESWRLVLPSGRVVGRVKAAGERRYYLTDRLGSVRTVIDGDGRVVEVRDYYPFGLRMPGRSRVEGTPAVEDYTSHARDRASGLLYAGARYLMPALGRWMTTEPLLEGNPNQLMKDGKDQLLATSPYNYSFNNPVNLTDPTGLLPVACPPCGGGLLGPLNIQEARQMQQAVVGMPNVRPSASRPTLIGEGIFALGNPRAALAIGWYSEGSINISTTTANFAVNSGLSSGQGSPRNAVRHVTWQATIASQFGSRTAAFAGFAHESDPGLRNGGSTFAELPKADSYADMQNNIIGRGLAESNPGASMLELGMQTLEAFKNEGLYVVTGSQEQGYSVERVRLSQEQYEQAQERLREIYEN